MHSLSTSHISLHSYAGSHHAETKTKKKSDPKPSIIYSFALFYSFLSMGFGSGLLGPTLLKYVDQTNSPFDRVVYILVVRSFGFLAGTLIGGALVDRFAAFGRTLLASAIFFMCLATVTIPFIFQLIPMIFIHLMWSLSAGILDNLAQILMIRHYENFNVNPYLQALHGAFGVGGFLAPLIIAPFLEKTSAPDQWYYAYWLIGILHVPNFIWVLIHAIRDEFCARKIEELDLENKEFVSDSAKVQEIIATDEESSTSKSVSSGGIFILGLMTLLLLLIVGAEAGFGSYIHTYATLHLSFEKDTAAYLNSAFWASFAFGRLCGIPLSIKFTPLQMIFCDLFGSIASLALLFAFNKSTVMLWISSILFGLTGASIYASAITFTEQYVSITGKRMSMLVVGGSAGDALIPLLIGYSLNSKLIGSIGFVVIILAVVILASILFTAIATYLKRQSKKTSQNDSQ